MQQKFEKDNTHLLKDFITAITYLAVLSGLIMIAVFLSSCNSSSGNTGYGQMPPPVLPVITVNNQPATTYQEFSASLEGSKDIEIRPQVDGYLDQIYIDEGAQVKKGQLLFRINERPYR